MAKRSTGLKVFDHLSREVENTHMETPRTNFVLSPWCLETQVLEFTSS